MKTTNNPEPLAVNLPGWANWIAQDANGAWWCYEAEPNQAENGWYENEVGRSTKLSQGQPNQNWEASLKKIQTN